MTAATTALVVAVDRADARKAAAAIDKLINRIRNEKNSFVREVQIANIVPGLIETRDSLLAAIDRADTEAVQ